MNDGTVKDRLQWMHKLLFSTRGDITRLIARLRGVSASPKNEPAVHKKFAALMSQIAVEREKEVKLLDQIEDLEKRHQTLKQNNLLERLSQEAHRKRTRQEKTSDKEKDNEEKAATKDWKLLLFLGLAFTSRWNIFASNKDPEKKEPTVR